VYEQVVRLAELALAVRADVPFFRARRRRRRLGRRRRCQGLGLWSSPAGCRRLPAGGRANAAAYGRHGGRAISGDGAAAPARGPGGCGPVHVVVVNQHVAPLIGVPPKRGWIQPCGERGRAGHRRRGHRSSAVDAASAPVVGCSRW